MASRLRTTTSTAWRSISMMRRQVELQPTERHVQVDRPVPFTFLPVQPAAQVVDVEAFGRLNVIHAQDWDNRGDLQVDPRRNLAEH